LDVTVQCLYDSGLQARSSSVTGCLNGGCVQCFVVKLTVSKVCDFVNVVDTSVMCCSSGDGLCCTVSALMMWNVESDKMRSASFLSLCVPPVTCQWCLGNLLWNFDVFAKANLSFRKCRSCVACVPYGSLFCSGCLVECCVYQGSLICNLRYVIIHDGSHQLEYGRTRQCAKHLSMLCYNSGWKVHMQGWSLLAATGQ
jgi:hypothetical protein